MNRTNDITRLLHIGYPIIQAPMFGVATPEMVAAAAKVDCLGSLPLGDLPADKCIAAIRATRQLTDQPFAVNIFVNDIPEISAALRDKYAQVRQFINQLALQNDLDVQLPDIDDIKTGSYQEQIEAIIAEKCRIVSFTFGNLDLKSIQRLKDNDTILIGTCTSVREALILEKSGIDLICVQGIEAGGHRGTFSTTEIPEIGGLSLLSRVRENVQVPLIYAGGLYNGKTIAAAKILGAGGFQIGSLLLGSAESALKDFEKDRLRAVHENDIVLTKSFSGRYARGIKNKFIEAVENTAHILPYPYQNKLTNELRRKAKEQQNPDFVSIWVGQSITDFSGQSTAEILRNLITDMEHNC